MSGGERKNIQSEKERVGERERVVEKEKREKGSGKERVLVKLVILCGGGRW